LGFSETLSQIVDRIEGSVAAMILGIDGIAIERYIRGTPTDLDIEIVATEFTTLLRRAAHTASDTDLGQMREMVLSSEKGHFLLRPMTSDYFLLLILEPNSSVGRARFELRKAELALAEEFAI
jgi:predicted regulator of Ras-like GTPase activity (Roadblock/LC7/MglB family)